MIGIVYGVVNLNSGVIEKIGSTTRTLGQRSAGYRQRQKWFSDSTHKLVSLRVVEHDDPNFFDVLIKSVETFEICRNNTWFEQGGRNLMSPLVQFIDHEMTEAQMAVLGGRATAAIPGHMSRAGKIGGCVGGAKGGRIAGQMSVENGRLASLRTPEHQSAAARRSFEIHGRLLTTEACSKGGQISGRLARENGQLRRVTTKESCFKGGTASAHSRWHTGRGQINPACSLCLQKAAA